MTSNKELEVRRRAKSDFPFYARSFLKVRAKAFVDGEASNITKFHLNKAQLYIHSIIEQQKKETGKVRVIILKGRQQGCSTYVQGRFIWLLTHSKGYRAFILTHEEMASQNLFDITKRYYESLPLQLRPSISASNAKELLFDRLDSGYKVGTAGNKSVGRSMTNQLLHGSEVAFWPNAAEHAKGILQTVADAEGTEIILESTANGVGNYFHEQWVSATNGESEYIPIFVPWFWQEEYTAKVPPNFELTAEEADLVDAYGLSPAQLSWRRKKIVELSAGGMDGLKAFQQEYPNNAIEAFQVSGDGGLISPDVVMRARKRTELGSGPLIVGVDPSRGGDRFAIIKRQGRKAYDIRVWRDDAVDTLGKMVSKCKAVLDEICPIAKKRPDMMFIDAGGGADLVDRLHELGYGDRVKAIYFGSSPLDDKRWRNKRAEMWGLMNEWLSDENYLTDIPDDDALHADLAASPYDRDSNDRIKLWDKKKIKEKYGVSPDLGDALALTFAEPVDISVYYENFFDDYDDSRDAVGGY